ncbi:hypothetical protein Q763_01515 [Flavobacterium beibuense F44-8]|uniref:Uncharacterized protein n=1 Tax=Flavobacterium beibuense F44-8 TaxID=1406840 RepID=A0A0A2LVQ4_9FLAO|nr:hypothetical protein [Flavobacterium beibuense]KGO84447.1 hypothetical protein Q763_01515 [Flavobacterium beibuense F44-8]
MKNINLTKVKQDEIKVMQEQVLLYSDALTSTVKGLEIEDFLNVISTIDISFRLWLTFRKKVEGVQEKFTVNLKVSEAATLLKCFMWSGQNRSPYENHVAEKYKTIIDNQLKNI